jgi:hypothetical protein
MTKHQDNTFNADDDIVNVLLNLGFTDTMKLIAETFLNEAMLHERSLFLAAPN